MQPRLHMHVNLLRSNICSMLKQWITTTLTTRHAMTMSSRWTMTPFHAEVRSRIELDLRSYQERVLPEHLQTISDRGWNRTIGLLRVMQAS